MDEQIKLPVRYDEMTECLVTEDGEWIAVGVGNLVRARSIGHQIAVALNATRREDALVERMEAGRHYLMSVDAEAITVEDALEAFGFGRNGLA